MEATSMMKLLKSFCDHSHWNYAVFWKLSHHFPLTLTWEDGYYGGLKTNEAAEIMWMGVASSSCESTHSSEENSVRSLMIEMSHLKYILGEGVVGKVALTGDHSWILFEDIPTGKFQTNLMNEYSYEWLLQFASAIKTIVLVPVLPQGVLQFGSFKAVAEDLAFVANVKEKFNFFRRVMANTPLLSSDENIQDWAFSALTDCPLDNSDMSSITNSILTHEYFGGNLLDRNELKSNPNVPLFVPVEGSMSRKNETGIPSIRVSNDNEQVEVKSNQLEEVIETCSPWLNNVQIIGETSERLFSYSHTDMAEQFGGTGTDFEYNMVNSFCSFPLDSELQKALGPAASRKTSEPESENFSLKDTYSTSSTLISGEKGHGHIMVSHIHKSEHLLDAVVGNLRSASDDSSSTLPTVLTASIHPQSHSEGSTLIVKNADSSSHLTSAFGANIDYDCTDLLTLASLDDNSSILLDGAQQDSIHIHKQSKSGSKLSSIGKKRVCVGSTSRPRPRDRQLIMDRMKELRELVPDGAKCSIDNLLDRTIKHMLYLREITHQAEKLKKIENKEVPEFKKQKISGNHTGRSCAINFGSELQVCPIVIEDLECPGHMLIEVICSEHGLFLEIAQVIRQLELTILKGVLESSSSTAWARFIVEVPRGFHRMDVLCPLLHLLQTGTSPVSSRI